VVDGTTVEAVENDWQKRWLVEGDELTVALAREPEGRSNKGGRAKIFCNEGEPMAK
jgi:hypothetical protein